MQSYHHKLFYFLSLPITITNTAAFPSTVPPNTRPRLVLSVCNDGQIAIQDCFIDRKALTASHSAVK